MEDVLQIEFHKRNRGRPKTEISLLDQSLKFSSMTWPMWESGQQMIMKMLIESQHYEEINKTMIMILTI